MSEPENERAMKFNKRRAIIVFIIAFALIEGFYQVSFFLPFRADEALARKNIKRLQAMVDKSLAERPELKKVYPDDLFLVDVIGDFSKLPEDLRRVMEKHRYILEDGVRVNSEKYYQNPLILHFMGIVILAVIAALLLAGKTAAEPIPADPAEGSHE